MRRFEDGEARLCDWARRWNSEAHLEIGDEVRYRVAIVHDYLTQRGGAERVVEQLARLYPDAPIYTSVYAPESSFDYFQERQVIEIAPAWARPILRRDHRLGLFHYASWFRNTTVEADVAICSSSAYAHFTTVSGKKVVYCHNPARWLHGQTEYGVGGAAAAALVGLLGERSRRLDRAAAQTADLYIANSSVVRERIRAAYGLDAKLAFPPVAPIERDRSAEEEASDYYLIVSRLLPYKNVLPVARAFRTTEVLADKRLVIVGDGPLANDVRDLAGGNVEYRGRVDDEELAGLYAGAKALVAPAYEDFGLTPIEAAWYGVPTVALDFGGYKDTVIPGTTGVFMCDTEPESIQSALVEFESTEFSRTVIRRHAESFSPRTFSYRLSALIDELGGPVVAGG